MNDLTKIPHEQLSKLLIETDDMVVLEEMARRINLGLIPLALVGFSKLSNKKLTRLDNLTFENCSWAFGEIYKRMEEGKIPKGKVVTIEEIRDMYRRAREAKA